MFQVPSIYILFFYNVSTIRYYFAGPLKGSRSIYVENLPGFPDNIRISLDGQRFYVGLAGNRYDGGVVLFDKLGSSPWLRKAILELIPERYLAQMFLNLGPKYGIFVVLDAQSGKVVNAHQDPSGLVVDGISQVRIEMTIKFFRFFNVI